MEKSIYTCKPVHLIGRCLPGPAYASHYARLYSQPAGIEMEKVEAQAHLDTLNKLQKELTVINTMPSRVFFNEQKRTTVLVFNDNFNGAHTFVAKASDLDDFDKELGFLVAYYHRIQEASKTKTRADNEWLFSMDAKFLKGNLYVHLQQKAGMSLEKAQAYVKRILKRAETTI